MDESGKKPNQLQLNLNDSMDKESLQAENIRLREQYARSLAEIERLQRIVDSMSKPNCVSEEHSSVMQTTDLIQVSKRSPKVTKQSSSEEKVALFRRYFKGREDVYAVRGIDKAGKSTYYPKRQYLGKEKGKAVWGENLPLTDAVIKDHLQNEDRPVTVGIYPMLLDETCWFLAVDFDKKSWQEDTAAFLQICHSFHIPAALERSRSGNGGHVWIFFAEALPARTARMLGSALLTLTLDMRHQIGLDSYDRLFPNQDTLPKEKKLGNLIALPLQRMPGKENNSLFIDENYQHYKDQWAFLSSLRKMTLAEVETIVQTAERKGEIIRIAKSATEGDEEIEPWKISLNREKSFLEGPLPSSIKLVLSNMLYIEKQGLSSSQINHFIRTAAFQNPEFYKAQSMRLSTKGIPRIINCSEDFAHYLALPRGCYEKVVELLQSRGVEKEFVDERNPGSQIDVVFQGELRNEQLQTVHELVKHDTGVLSATTAFGKTVIGAWMIAARAVNTLILVHRKQLMDQWREQLAFFLNIPANEIGFIGGGKDKRTGRIDIAMLQTIHAKGEIKDFVTDYGHIIVDECHHISAFSFEQVLKKVTAKYILGLTATLTRKDGHHPIVLMQCGPVRYKVDARTQAKARHFEHAVIPRHTDFKLQESGTDVPIHEYYEKLITDELRNNLIFDDLLKALDQGRSPILLTDRTSHLEYFQNRLNGFAKNVIVMRGGMGKKQWKTIHEQLRSIPSDQERVLLATGKFAGEGFDDARLDTLFLVMPISWQGTLQQYAGRLHRQYEGKREVQVYDYVDIHVPMFMRMYNKRLKGYQAMGYSQKTNTELF
jgi:superfamily II DNA or RNA helicase